MTISAAAASGEVYRRRHFAHGGLWSDPLASPLKVYTIVAGGNSLNADLMATARMVVEREMAGVDKPGFVVVHHGEDAIWLLLHWWMDGGILAQRLWRTASVHEPRFEAVDRPLMACVWELVPIAFERDAYVATVMNNGCVENYLEKILPEGDY